MAVDFVAGCLGGCAGVIIGHPFDTIKVKLQTQDYRNPIYRGTWDCFVKILKAESMAGVYRGVSSPMAGVAVVNAIVFGVYGNVQRTMSSPDSLPSHFMAGAMAGLVQSVVASPVELVKTRVQTSTQYEGTIDCLMKTFKQEGVQGVFKGLGITGAREFLGYGLYFATYEAMTRTSPGGAPVGTASMLFAGGMSGIVSWMATYPLDVIKTRLQADVGKYSSIADCITKSVRQEGLIFLTRGLTPTLIRAFPTNAVTFTVVTWVFRLVDSFQKSGSINDSINSFLELLPRQKYKLNTLDVIEGSVNNIDLTWLSRKQPQRHFLLTEDYWTDDEYDYFEELNNISLCKNNFNDINANIEPNSTDKNGISTFTSATKISSCDLTNEIENATQEFKKGLR